MPLNRDIKKVLVIGSGPIIIGQAAEFDYSGTQACQALKEEGIEVVLVNSNPATIMTDKEVADKVYLEPLTLEFLEKVIAKERPDSLLAGMGGQTGLNLAVDLSDAGILDKYNVKVVYDTYDTNEEMFAVINSGGRVYDVLCPTDYMIEKMINQNLLYSYDLTTLKNYENIDKRIFKIIQSFDKNNTYVIPYVHSTLGLIYNKTILDEKNLPYPKSWGDLWYEGYKKEIFMQDAMRDLLMVGLKKNNFSMNTTNQNELDIATADLIKQKPLVNAYMIDTLRDKMVSGEGAISVMYSGEVEYIITEGKKYEYEYILPTEGVNFTIDAWVIPQNSQNN